MNIQVRSADDIVERVGQIRDDDFFGFRQEVLLPYLDVDRIRPFLKPDADLSDWEPSPLHAEPIAGELRDYMEFAWGKVEDHRGISASRSVEKIGEWLWVLGLDDVLAEFEQTPYPQYGAPQLAVACRALRLPIPNNEGIARMIQGLPCEPYCDGGCGS